MKNSLRALFFTTVLFALAEVPDLSASPLPFRISRIDRGKTLEFAVTPASAVERCQYQLYGARKRRAVARRAPRGSALLHEWEIDENRSKAAVFLVEELSPLRRGKQRQKKRAFFRVREQCNGQTTLSRVRRVSLRSRRRGETLSYRNFFQELREKLPYSEITLTEVFSELSFRQPVDIRTAGDGSGRMFLVEQGGTIQVVQPGGAAQGIFLDISDRTTASGERGLLSIAFHPEYATNGYAFIHFTDETGSTVVERFTVDNENEDALDPTTRKEILTVEQPSAVHNGGSLLFGGDGYLYVTLGDGGSQLDPEANGQDPTTLLGSILRIDIDTDDETPYEIPADNPFAESSGGERGEIYAYGFRNPWRAAFDRTTGELWTGDVGQSSFEEINRVVRGENYGWVTMEGTQCVVEGCDSTGLTLPVHAYGRELGRSVTGGYVYRGEALFSLSGRYLFGDFISGRIFVLEESEASTGRLATPIRDTDAFISTFGEDEDGELYYADYGTGGIYRLEARNARRNRSPITPPKSSG